ncbi:NTP transferase domain-containing protein [Alphaproteobacteria bacterium]|nr:NTP transferase domain-containing protein [Alphaproteobacteria bacterium]
MNVAKPNTAIVLAAGLGSRLNLQAGVPKPLVKVDGITLAERVLLSLRIGGDVRRCVIPVGHRAQEVVAHFEEVGRLHDMEIIPIPVKDWHLGNGTSMLASRGHTGSQPFFISMSDHLFDPYIATALTKSPPKPDEMCLAIDRNKDGIFDLDDVTRVQTKNGKIEAIQKDLSYWDAADTGVMLCSTALFDGLERAAANGQHGLSDGLRQLANQKKARAVDVTGNFWLDVDTPEAHAEAELQEKNKAKHGTYQSISAFETVKVRHADVVGAPNKEAPSDEVR